MIPDPRSRIRIVAVAIAAVLYVGPLLLDAPLTDPDEGRHAVISQEMIERGDLIVPRLFGTPFLDKPVLFFWAQAASMRAFGMTTAAARLPGLVFALLGIASTGWLARVLFADARRTLPGPPIAWVTAACYATMVLPFLLAQAPVHDMALVPFTNVAIGFLWRALRDSGFNIRHSIIAGIALGISTLVKGLEGIAIVGASFAIYLLLTRTLTRQMVLIGLAVIAVAVFVALPWYLAMEAREPGYVGYYFLNRHLLGFTTATQRHGGQAWWYYLPLVVAGGLPWIVYVRGRTMSDPAGKLVWTWLVASVVLLSLSNSKTVTYILPAMPAVTILAARSEAAWRQWRVVAIGAGAVYALALILAGPSVARTHSSVDLAEYFNREGRVPDRMFVMESRVSFVYYLRPDVRALMHRDQIRTLTLDELAALEPYPHDAVLALPADLAEARLARLPQLAQAHRKQVGRYLLIWP